MGGRGLDRYIGVHLFHGGLLLTMVMTQGQVLFGERKVGGWRRHVGYLIEDGVELDGLCLLTRQMRGSMCEVERG